MQFDVGLKQSDSFSMYCAEVCHLKDVGSKTFNSILQWCIRRFAHAKGRGYLFQCFTRESLESELRNDWIRGFLKTPNFSECCCLFFVFFPVSFFCFSRLFSCSSICLYSEFCFVYERIAVLSRIKLTGTHALVEHPFRCFVNFLSFCFVFAIYFTLGFRFNFAKHTVRMANCSSRPKNLEHRTIGNSLKDPTKVAWHVCSSYCNLIKRSSSLNPNSMNKKHNH